MCILKSRYVNSNKHMKMSLANALNRVGVSLCLVLVLLQSSKASNALVVFCYFQLYFQGEMQSPVSHPTLI